VEALGSLATDSLQAKTYKSLATGRNRVHHPAIVEFEGIRIRTGERRHGEY
jgi:hypothetical protein